MRIRCRAAGRVNLIGDHTDYMGGLAMPMAIDLGTTIAAELDGTPRLVLDSDAAAGRLELGLPVHDASGVSPPWGRYVAAVADELGARTGGTAAMTSTLPVGAGLSSSAALEVACSLVLLAAAAPSDPSDGCPEVLVPLRGDPRSPDGPQRLALAQLCQRAEQAAVGVPSGIMDQLCVCSAREGSATLIDCSVPSVQHVAVPDAAAVWVLHSGRAREIAGSSYAQRRRSAEAAAELLGPLPSADRRSIEALGDPVLRRRARHVRSECDRVLAFAAALEGGDLPGAGDLMAASHASLRDDYEVSTSELDALTDALSGVDGVHGARLTGAGFGGCVVALADAGVDLADPARGLHGVASGALMAWRVSPAEGFGVELDPEAA